MGYNNSATTTTLTAKLTPLGRKKLIVTNNNLISSFSLGDSDANYFAALPLTTGQVPGDGGDNGPYSSVSNSVAPNTSIKSYLIANKSGDLKKAVAPQSSAVTTDFISNGVSIATASGGTLTQNLIDRNNGNTDSLVNLFYTFNLPLDSNGEYYFTGVTSDKGGFSDTALSGIANTQIAVIGIDNTTYGELIDGKTIKIQITTSLPATYTIYSTFQNTGMPATMQDASYVDTASNTKFLGENIAFLVSDDIQTPNGGNPSLSWATGYNTVKPFSINKKQQYNFVTDTNVNENVDTVVGIAYLDKGFMVITHPTIVDFFDPTSTATTVTFTSLSTSVMQNVTCIADRGEFVSTTNPTFRVGDTLRISEVGLYDNDMDLIAIAKLDRHLTKNVNDFFALGVKISL
jgi:hypothetical protein